MICTTAAGAKRSYRSVNSVRTKRYRGGVVVGNTLFGSGETITLRVTGRPKTGKT